MNEILNTLEPKLIWQYFGEILQIPRPSKKEEKIREYLVEFGKKHGLETLVDKTGNVLIRKNATKGMEDRQIVALQAHMDMVCEKNADSKHDFLKDPIEVEFKDGWLKAKETTLGADNGIGVAAALAILASDDICHGPLECLFTVDEETGLTGAFGLEEGFLKANILLNLDSEDDGQFFIGCAGGIDTLVSVPIATENIASNLDAAYIVEVKGLKGGHSGDDINKGLGNANKFLIRLLDIAYEKYSLRLFNINGGNLRNAIAREAFAKVVLPKAMAKDFEAEVENFNKVLQNEFKLTEPGLKLSAAATELPSQVFEDKRSRALIDAIFACPHGVLRMSSEIANFVETSTNLASIKYISKENRIEITTSQRSSVESAKKGAARRIAAVFRLLGNDVVIKHSDGYPGWAPNASSPILKICLDSYRELFKEEAVALAIHAGLECGLFGEKIPGLDMVSYGPTMRGVHSPDERLEIATVAKFWDLTLDILKRIPKK